MFEVLTFMKEVLFTGKLSECYAFLAAWEIFASEVQQCEEPLSIRKSYPED